MPTALALKGNDKDAPKDYATYKQFIQAVVQHCVDKYGAADVGQWYWEVWNEPDYSGFWNGTNASEAVTAKMTEYYTLYDNAVAAITAVLPNAFVGGPATTGPNQVAAFLQHCKTAGTRVTFASSHVYPGGASGSNAASANGLLNDNNTRVSGITSGGYTTTAVKSFNTEWNSSYNGQGGRTGDVLVEHGQPLERALHPQGHQAALGQELGRHAAPGRVLVLGALGRLRRVERPLGLVHPGQDRGRNAAVRPGVRRDDVPGHAQGGVQRASRC